MLTKSTPGKSTAPNLDPTGRSINLNELALGPLLSESRITISLFPSQPL
jgi:hypothetical protein